MTRAAPGSPQALIREETRHIPRGPLPQNELRMVYAIQRQHDLAGDIAPTARASLESALQSVRSRHHGFLPKYDAEFFGGRD